MFLFHFSVSFMFSVFKTVKVEFISSLIQPSLVKKNLLCFDNYNCKISDVFQKPPN